ncbi:MAG: anaerobic ribonucleoside-triphosphate reductase activating protein [Candidatus Izemoplasmatales bacterium]
MIVDFIPLTLVDYPNHIASVCFFRGCQLRCIYCHNSPLVLPKLLTDTDSEKEEEFFLYLLKYQNIIEGVCITGGEPLLDNNLEDFIKRIKSLGFLVKLDTNGFLPDKLELLLSKGILDYVALDFKGLCKDLGYLIGLSDRVCKEYFSAFEKSLKILQKYSIDFEVRTTVIKEVHTKETLIKMSNHLEKMIYKEKVNWYLQNYQESENNLYRFTNKSISISSCDTELLEETKEILKYNYIIR